MGQSSIARPIDTSAIDGTVAQVDVPDTIQYVKCDEKDPNCVVLNHIGIHSVDDVTDHLGRQSEILSNSAANALDDESQPDLASSVRKTGKHTHEELSNSVGNKEYHARDEGSITPPIKDKLKDTIVENDPFEPTFKYVGDTASRTGTLVGDLTGDDGKDAPLQDTGLDVVGAQGKAVSSLGGGVEGFGNEADRIFSDGAAPACGPKGDCARVIDVIPDV